MADALATTLTLENLDEEDSLLHKPPDTQFMPDEKPSDSSNNQYSINTSQKSGFDFEVNLQPEKILEVLNLPDGSRSYRMKWKDTWIHEGLMPAYQNLVDEFWKEQNNKRKKQQVSSQENNELQFPVKDVPAKSSKQTSEKLEEDQSTTNTDPDNNINIILMDRTMNTEEEVQDKSPANDMNNQAEADKDCKNEDEADDEKPTVGRKRKNTKPTRRKAKKVKKGTLKTVIKKKVDEEQKCEEEEKENHDEQQNGEIDGEKLENEGGDANKEDSTADDKGGRHVYSEDKGPCTCNICGKVISNKYGLREHQTVVHFKNGKFACEICGKRVTNKRALNLHMTSHSTERKFVCDLCGSSHKTKGNLNYHIKTMHTMIKNFRCDICFKTFKVQAELKDHCFSVHANEGVITCIVCKKKLTTALSIYTHSVMHSGAREHECTQCGYAFKTATGLKEHMVTHSEEKPVRQCPHCDRKFYSRSQYNAHVMRHTADGSLITYKCPICDVKFQHKSSYNRHVIRHQPGGDLEYPKQNPYLLLDESELPEGVCHKCRKHYSSKSGFYLHLKKCRDGIVQQFQCPFCERGCSNRSSLKRHIQRRHKGMEFEGQTVRGRDIPAEDVNEAAGTHQTAVLTQDGIQYQNAYFDHGYGNQITAVDPSQLATVDVQLLIDTATAQDGQTTAQILSNVGQVAQLTQNGDSTQNLHIVSENDVAQLAAQLSQHGVIVRSSANVSNEHTQGQHLIVSSAQIDARTGQLLMSESQAAQIIADAEALQQSRNQIPNEGTITLQSPADQSNLLHFNNRTAVIQIQHTGSEGITGQQVLTIPQEQVAQLTAQNIQNSNVHVTELQHSTDIGEIEQENSSSVQHFIQEEQIVSNMTGAENDVEHTYQSIDM